MFKFKRRRRPVWQPSRTSRLIGFLRGLLKQLTFKRVVLAVFVLPLLFYIYREVSHDALIIEPFSVPKSFEESGLTPEVMSNRIGDAMRQIEIDTKTGMKKDRLTSLRDEGATPDVEIPGTKLGLKTLVEINALDDKKKYDEAIAKYEKATELDPKDAVAYHNWGNVLHEQGKQDEAIAKYEKATELDPKNAFAYNNWGSVLQEQKKYNEAIAKYEKATELDPKNAVVLQQLGSRAL